jgi:nucleoside-diphosphate-sugar epimerase
MKILITGGNGFLGSHFINKLQNENHEIFVILRNTQNIREKILNFCPEVVVNFSWRGGNNYESVNDINQFNNVVKGIELLNILSELQKKPKFIGIGSFSEYGTLKNPATETDKEYPNNLYGLSKYTFKNYSKILCQKFNMKWCWVRPCYIYGPGDVTTRLIPKIINTIIKNEKLELDSCNKIIDYLYVSDFTNYLYSLIINDDTNGIYNLCSGNQYNLKDVIYEICDLMDSSNNITFKSTPSRNLTSPIICGNNDKIKKISNIKKLVGLKEGLTKTINYYKNERINNIEKQ